MNTSPERQAERNASPFQPAPGTEHPNGHAPAAATGAQGPAPNRCPNCQGGVSPGMRECPACHTILFFEAATFEERMERMKGYSLGELLLRERAFLFEAIYKERDLNSKIEYFACWAFLFAALYGALLGTYGGWLQIPTVAAKIPILLFGTLGICAPALFTFNVLLGSNLTLKQTLAMLVISTYLTSAILASLAPIVFFFILSGSGRDFVLLLNVIACAIAGGFGVALLWGGMKYMTVKSGQEPNLAILKTWSVIYMFVGTQLAWTLRPFVGTRGEFALFRTLGGDFYTAMLQLLQRLLW